MGRVIAALQRLAADLEQLRRFPAVTTEPWYRNAKWSCLPNDQSGLSVVTRRKDGVRVCRFDGRKLGFEILVAAAEFLLRNNCASISNKLLFEEFSQSDAVRSRYVAQ